MENNGNGRLLAVLDERTKRMDDFICDYIKRNDEALDDHEKRLRAVEQEQARIGERMTIAHGLQAAWSAVLMTIAAVIGSRQ